MPMFKGFTRLNAAWLGWIRTNVGRKKNSRLPIGISNRLKTNLIRVLRMISNRLLSSERLQSVLMVITIV